MKKFVLSLIALLMLASCADIASVIVEDELQRGLKNGQTNQKRSNCQLSTVNCQL